MGTRYTLLVDVVCEYLWMQKMKNLDTKGHSHSLWPQRNVHNISLEWLTMFSLHHFHIIIILPVLFGVDQISIHRFIIMLWYNQSCINFLTLNYTLFTYKVTICSFWGPSECGQLSSIGTQPTTLFISTYM